MNCDFPLLISSFPFGVDQKLDIVLFNSLINVAESVHGGSFSPGHQKGGG